MLIYRKEDRFLFIKHYVWLWPDVKRGPIVRPVLFLLIKLLFYLFFFIGIRELVREFPVLSRTHHGIHDQSDAKQYEGDTQKLPLVYAPVGTHFNLPGHLTLLTI